MLSQHLDRDTQLLIAEQCIRKGLCKQKSLKQVFETKYHTDGACLILKDKEFHKQGTDTPAASFIAEARQTSCVTLNSVSLAEHKDLERMYCITFLGAIHLD